MQDDATKKANQSEKAERPEEKIDELAEAPVSDRDAQSVKGGLRSSGGDDSPTERR